MGKFRRFFKEAFGRISYGRDNPEQLVPAFTTAAPPDEGPPMAQLESNPPAPDLTSPNTSINVPDVRNSNPAPITSTAILPALRPQLSSQSIHGSLCDCGQQSLNPKTGGILNNAQGVILNQPIVAEHITVHQASNVLKDMLSYVIHGTAFDSSDRDYPPRCHPHTRTRFLEELQTRIRDTSLGTRIAWLRGAAGIGKSAIMQTLAETLAETKSPSFTFTTLFFSRPNQRSDPKMVFTTLAYGLAVLDFKYCQYVGRRLAADPAFLTKSLEEQFKCLFLVPFVDGHVAVGSQRWVVILDGLDECDGEREQCRIVDLVRHSIVHHADSTPFIWIIASRPEAHLKAPFAQVKEETRSLWVLDIPMDSDESLRAVEVYLRAEFSKIRRSYSDLVPLSWPSENDFLALATTSNGLFIFASTLASYIAEHDPVVRLRELISLLAGRRTVAELKKNPFAAIDLLYTTILSDIPVDTLFTTKMILGHCLLRNVLGDESSITPRELYLSETCNLLGLEQHAVYAALRKLHSVLRLPGPKEAERQNIEFLHASFSDFLRDKNRSQSYHINLDKELANIWGCYLVFVRRSAASPSSRGIPISWEPEGDSQVFREHLLEIAQTKILSLLIYHCHDCTRCEMPGASTPRLLLSTSELVDAFDEFDILKSLTYSVQDLRDWLIHGHAPLAFSQRMVVREFGLNQMSDQDADAMFKGLCIRRWGYATGSDFRGWGIDLKNVSNLRWNQIKRLARNQDFDVPLASAGKISWEVLGGLLQAAREPINESAAQVVVFGANPSHYCAIIGPLKTYAAFGKNFSYLLVPYIESSSPSVA